MYNDNTFKKMYIELADSLDCISILIYSLLVLKEFPRKAFCIIIIGNMRPSAQ